MSQTQYHSLLGSILKQRHALATLRAKLEERRERTCFKCKRFGHLACNCRSNKEEEKRRQPQNKYEVLCHITENNNLIGG